MELGSLIHQREPQFDTLLESHSPRPVQARVHRHDVFPVNEGVELLPIFREEPGPVSEPPNLASKSPIDLWNSRLRIADTEAPQIFPSDDAMRFGLRYYTDEQFDRIRRATAERSEPIAPPIPLDD